MQISCRPATVKDCADVSSNMRGSDLLEIAAGSGQDAFQVLKSGIEYGPSYTILVDGVPAGIFGFCPRPEAKAAFIWFLGTDASTARATRRLWLTLAPAIIEYGRECYGTLLNTVWTGNKVHIKWLSHLGASFFDDDSEFSTFVFGE